MATLQGQSDPSTWVRVSTGLNCPNDPAKYNFTCDEFYAVLKDLHQEYLYLQQTVDFRNAVQDLVYGIQFEYSAEASSVASEVKAAIKPPATDQVGMQLLKHDAHSLLDRSRS